MADKKEKEVPKTPEEIKAEEALALLIPGEIIQPQKSITGKMIWIYGDVKIGKTTFASQFPGVWFLATEKGHDFVAARAPTTIDSWVAFKQIARQINDNLPTHFGDGERIETIVIDTVDDLHGMCQSFVCDAMGITDPSETTKGTAWNRLRAEFKRVMNFVRHWPYTLICISHCRQKEFKSTTRTIDRWEPRIGVSGFDWCSAASDLIMLAHMTETAVKNEAGEITGETKEDRMLLCHPKANAVAGGRMLEAVGLPKKIPLSFDSFLEYFPDSASKDKPKK